MHKILLTQNITIFAALPPPDPENASLEGCSVHAVAAAVGGFFRELPEPLLTRELYTEFIRAMGGCYHNCWDHLLVSW